jgi:hypothetical protein
MPDAVLPSWNDTPTRAQDHQWTVISMKRDWARVFADL